MTKILNKYYDTLPYLASEFGILEGKVNKLNTLVYIQQQFLWCVSFTVYHIVSGLLSLSSLVCPWRMVEGTGLLHHGMHVFSLMFSQQGMSNIFVYIYIQVFFYGLWVVGFELVGFYVYVQYLSLNRQCDVCQFLFGFSQFELLGFEDFVYLLQNRVYMYIVTDTNCVISRVCDLFFSFLYFFFLKKCSFYGFELVGGFSIFVA